MAYEAIEGNVHEATKGLTNRFAGEKITESLAITEAGAHTLVEPEAGHAITLFWIGLISSQENTEELLAAVNLEPFTPYQWYLGNPGAFMHWEPIEGEVGAPLLLSTSAEGALVVNYTYSEGVP